MPPNPQPKSAGRALIWILVVLAATIGTGIPIYRAASQNSTSTDSASVATNSIPTAILQLFQKEANSPPWNQDSPAKTQGIYRQCATLQQMLAANAADDALSNALAAASLRASVFMTFGESLYDSGDIHHAEMFFASLVNDHPTRITARQLSRCHLWLGKLYQDDALALKYQRRDTNQAAVLFQAAVIHFLAAKDASQDWVRGSGWLGAAACYRELGDQEMRRLCLQTLFNEQAASSEQNATTETNTNAAPDATLGLVQRDMAAYLLASSFYEDKRYAEAAEVYTQILTRVSATPEEYPGQAMYVGLANTGLGWCAARQAAQSGTSPSSSPNGEVVP